MSFRRRMVLLAAGAVAAAVVLASVVVYVVTRNELRAQIDASLRQKLTPGLPQAVKLQANLSPSELAKLRREGKLPALLSGPIAIHADGGGVASSSVHATAPAAAGKGLPREEVSVERKITLGPHEQRAQRSSLGGPAGAIARLVLPRSTLGGAIGYVQLLQADGTIVGSGRQRAAAPDHRRHPRGRRGPSRHLLQRRDRRGHARADTHRARSRTDAVWQVALPLTDVNSTLTHLKLVLAIVSLGGIALAAALGLLVSRAALVPVRRLTGAAERVARTQDLGASHRCRRGGRARQAGGELQHHAGRAGALAPGSAPARLRCLARAAHAADQRAGEPRRARARRAAARARARPHHRRRTARSCRS